MIKERMYELNFKVVEGLMAYMVQMEMEEPTKFELYTSVVGHGVYTDFPKVGDFFTMSMCSDGKDRLDGDLCIPTIYKDLEGFQEDMYWYLCEYLDFDIFNWGMRYGYTFEESMILFDICHELGHMKQWLHDVNRYDCFKTLEDEWRDREQLNYIFDEEELFIAYRQLGTENYADKTSVELLQKYGNALKQFMNRGLLIEVENVNKYLY